MSTRLKKRFLELLDKDPEFRYAVAGYLGLQEVLKRLDEHGRRLDEHGEAIRGLLGAVKGLQEAVRDLQEAVKGLQEAVRDLSVKVTAMEGAIRDLRVKVDALGTRYGIVTEEAFRASVKYLVEDLLKLYRVERWVYYDSEGLVYGRPSVVEVDVFIRDEERVLVEYKAHVDRQDVAELSRIGKLYERVTGVKPRLLLVAPTIRMRARGLAEELGVELRGALVE